MQSPLHSISKIKESPWGFGGQVVRVTKQQSLEHRWNGFIYQLLWSFSSSDGDDHVMRSKALDVKLHFNTGTFFKKLLELTVGLIPNSFSTELAQTGRNILRLEVWGW